jgi:hypothetical protein
MVKNFVYEDFLKTCGIQDVRPILLSTVYCNINTGEVCTPSPTVYTAHLL